MFTKISFPATGGPEDGKSIESNGLLCDGGVAWPAGMWTPDGHFYQLKFDENDQPTHWEYDASQNRPPAQPTSSGNDE